MQAEMQPESSAEAQALCAGPGLLVQVDPYVVMAQDIEQRRAQRYERQRKNYRQEHPRASNVTACAREMAYQLTDGELRNPPSIDLLQRFERGNAVESIVYRELLEDGWKVEAQQFAFAITERWVDVAAAPRTEQDITICTGHIDGWLECPRTGTRAIFEVKSIHPNVWARINSAQDFYDLGYFWWRYPAQLLLYCYANSQEVAYYILDDCLGHWKVIPLRLMDWLDETEAALQRCRTAEIAKLRKQAGQDDWEPAFCDDPTVCMGCWAREAGVCFPPIDTGKDVAVLESETLAADLERLGELAEAAAEHGKLDRKVKATFKEMGAGDRVCGNWVVHTKQGSTTSYDVPKDVKEQYKKTANRFTTTYERLA